MVDKGALVASLRRAFEELDRKAEIERRRYREGFDGLLGRIPDDASPLLVTIIREIQTYLTRKYSDSLARTLLQSAKNGLHSGEDTLRIPEGDLLALSILSKIHRALDAEGDRFVGVLLGKAGAHEFKRRDASRKERRPEITEWIRRQLALDAGVTGPELYQRAPTYVTDVVGLGRFCKRVTAQRKLRKADASQ